VAHTSERLCYCAEVFIVSKGKVLLRKHDKYKVWLSVGGHIEAAETPAEAAVREAQEEVGLKVELIGETSPSAGPDTGQLLPRAIVRHPITSELDHLVFIYFGLADSEQVVESDGERSNGWAWFSEAELSELKEDVHPNTIRFALQAIKELG
jgi:8-oxo-dGTP pyrophosphatase MutT (NUDIX family)